MDKFASDLKSDQSPFQIIEHMLINNSRGMNSLLLKLIESLKNLPIHIPIKQPKALILPGKVYDQKHAAKAFHYAKKKIKELYKELENSHYTIVAHQNASNQYTHSLVFRLA